MHTELHATYAYLCLSWDAPDHLVGTNKYESVSRYDDLYIILYKNKIAKMIIVKDLDHYHQCSTITKLN